MRKMAEEHCFKLWIIKLISMYHSETRANPQIYFMKPKHQTYSPEQYSTHKFRQTNK